jgi:hypothetical protein
MPTETQLQDTIHNWVTSVLTTTPCFWTGQDVKESHLTFPYISLNMVALTTIGTDFKGRPTSLGSAKVLGNRESMLIVNYYGKKTGASPTFSLNILNSSLNFDETMKPFRLLGIAIMEDEGIKDLSAILDDKAERRAQITFIVRWVHVQTDTNRGVIESVRIEQIIDNVQTTYTIDSTP